MTNYIAYYRVSTKKQSLGLEAQQDIISTYVANAGGTIISEYQEKESGKDVLAHRNLGHLLATFLKIHSVLLFGFGTSKLTMITTTNSC